MTYLTKVWVTDHRWWYVRTKRRYSLRVLHLGRLKFGIISYTLSNRR